MEATRRRPKAVAVTQSGRGLCSTFCPGLVRGSFPPSMSLLTAISRTERGLCCVGLQLGTGSSQRAAVSGQCMCVGSCCCILDDSEVGLSELKHRRFGNDRPELRTSGGSSDEAMGDGLKWFVSSLYSGSCGLSLLVDDAEATFGVPSPVPKMGFSTATDIDSELNCNVRCPEHETTLQLPTSHGVMPQGG